MAFQIKYVYDLVDRISPSLRKINNNVRKTERQIKKTAVVANTAFASISRSVRNLANQGIVRLKSSMGQLLVTFAAFAGVTKTVRVLADFDTEMSKVKAVTQATTQEMDQMRDLAKDLGITTEFTAGQAAAGMAFLGLTGFKTNEILQTMPGVLNLATAGQLDLATAADISSNILKGFNLDASEMGRVVDVMAITATNANTNIQQLGDAMKFVAPVAAISGISIEKASAAIGVLSDAGLQATLAGTGLRRIISELANPTRAAVKEFVKLGISQKDIDVKSRGLEAVLKTLAPIAKDTGAAFKIFGDRGAPAFTVLSQNIDKVKKLSAEMLNTEDAGKRLAETMRDNLGGDFKALLSAIEGNILGLGERGLTGGLRSVTQSITKFFRAFGGGEAFDELGVSAQGFIQILQLLGKVIGFVFKVLGVVFKVALDGLDAVLEGINLLIEPFLKLNNLITQGIGKGIGKVIDLGKNLFTAEQKTENINTVNTINTAQAVRQEPTKVDVGGQLGININGLPKGSNTNFAPAPNNQMKVGINSILQGV